MKIQSRISSFSFVSKEFMLGPTLCHTCYQLKAFIVRQKDTNTLEKILVDQTENLFEYNEIGREIKCECKVPELKEELYSFSTSLNLQKWNSYMTQYLILIIKEIGRNPLITLYEKENGNKKYIKDTQVSKGF